MEFKLRQNAVDLTDLAIGIIILGIVVSVGSAILITQRDARLTELSTVTTNNETLTTVTEAGEDLTNTWVKSVDICTNATGGETIASGNYTLAIDSNFGTGTVSAATGSTYNNSNWNCSYTWYNTSRADWALVDDAATGIGEYGNWFKIIVIVGIAAVVLSIIFMSFGRRGTEVSGSY